MVNAAGKPVVDHAVEGTATYLLDWIAIHSGGIDLVAVCHRIAYGGSEFAAPVAITPTLQERLEALSPLAPSTSLASITAHPGLLQVACFDTAFHATEPKGVRRYLAETDLADVEQGIVIRDNGRFRLKQNRMPAA